MTVSTFDLNSQPTAIIWPERREIPCRDLDLDCFAFDGQIPFGDYARCQAYAPELGRCIFLSTNGGGA